jgi:TldD protein
LQKEAKKIIEFIIENGASYADIRIFTKDQKESIQVLNGEVEQLSQSLAAGYGIRVLYKGSWGFASHENFDNFLSTAKLALENAQSSSLYRQDEIKLAPKKIFKQNFNTQTEIDPFEVPIKEKIERLLFLEDKLKHSKFDYRGASLNLYKREIFYLDSEGAEINKNLLDVEAGLWANAFDSNSQKQSRSYYLPQDPNTSVGWENILSDTQFNHGDRLKNELLSLLEAPKCPEEVCDLILLPEMMALQTHETIGHALELDRILGYELSYAGGSHVSLQDFGKLTFGSNKLNARADGTVKNSPGSEGFDDDGVIGKNIPLIEKGLLVNAITSRQMITEANAKANKKIFSESGGANRAQSYYSLPIERMNNINIDPGNDGNLEDIIKNTKNGLLVEAPTSWSIGSNRENFHFACEIGWKIIDGKISHVVANPTYRGDSLPFWKSLDLVGNSESWQLQQVFYCGKGQPNQAMRLGHGVPVCRFKNVQVGK